MCSTDKIGPGEHANGAFEVRNRLTLRRFVDEMLRRSILLHNGDPEESPLRTRHRNASSVDVWSSRVSTVACDHVTDLSLCHLCLPCLRRVTHEVRNSSMCVLLFRRLQNTVRRRVFMW
jgi:hypothetical protein